MVIINDLCLLYAHSLPLGGGKRKIEMDRATVSNYIFVQENLSGFSSEGIPQNHVVYFYEIFGL